MERHPAIAQNRRIPDRAKGERKSTSTQVYHEQHQQERYSEQWNSSNANISCYAYIRMEEVNSHKKERLLVRAGTNKQPL